MAVKEAEQIEPTEGEPEGYGKSVDDTNAKPVDSTEN